MMRVLLFLCGFIPGAWATDKDPRPEMHALAQEISSLEKFVLSEQQFIDPKNDGAIRQSLHSMNEHIAVLGKGTFTSDPALKVNLSLLKGHLQDTERFFREGNKPYARFMLQSSLQMCIACHTRGKVNVDFALPEESLKAASPLELGDFLFATRQFDKGRVAYEKVVTSNATKPVGAFALRKALLALAVYYARVKEDPKGGKDYFATVARHADLPAYLQKEVKAWTADFSAWAKEKPQAKPQKEAEQVEAAKRLLRTDNFHLVGATDRLFHIKRLRASALLHRALEAPGEKSPVKGEALYYLGQIYHRIQQQLFFRFGEMYLKACIQDYPKTPVAKNCYQAYEEAVTEGFTGSAGTNIPADETAELLRLQQIAF